MQTYSSSWAQIPRRSPAVIAASWRAHDGSRQRGTACPLLYRYRLSHTYCSLARLPPTHPFVCAPTLQRHFQVRWRARLPHPRVLLPHTCTVDGWFLQPKRRPARYTQPRSLENRTRLSNGFRGLGFGVGKIIPGYRFW